MARKTSLPVLWCATVKLREYQERLVNAVFEKWRTNRSTLIVAAVGCGKTVIFAEIIRRAQPGRALVLAHRTELIDQAREKVESLGLPCEIEKADLFAARNLFHASPVVVGSIQTQCSGPKTKRRYTRFQPTDFSVLVCDEAHRSAAQSWREVIDYYKQNPNLKVLGVTATPERFDKQSIYRLFECTPETIAGKYEIRPAIDDGYLVEITQQFCTVRGLDYSHLHTKAGDLNEGELAKVLELERNVHGMCQPTLEAMHGLTPHTLDSIPVTEWKTYLKSLGVIPRRTIIFTASVAQSEMYSDVFSRAMDGVEWVCGATRKEDRRAILARFTKGETHAVINCDVLSEGFDNPFVELIVIARATLSIGRYIQWIGRSTRPLPGLVDEPGMDTAEKRRAAIAASAKPFARIIDLCGKNGRHKLISCMDVLGGGTSEPVIREAIRKAQQEGKPVRVLRAITNAEKEVERQKAEEAERRRRQEAARKAHLLLRSQYSMREVNPFDRADSMQTHGEFKRNGKQFSVKQAIFLRRWCGVDPNRIPYGYGVKLIAAKSAEWDKKKVSAT